ncbi:hypothetical protein OPV22_001514 [Ensete ventricosum]|uniref:Uncharacterized protein n=1 Tax=Ensete ventricosum TaxID=4639 RepID=A0AAV8RRF3_ENSVE|nr:hypothetical protein OPV22_001514 [Ensete ventricosum]
MLGSTPTRSRRYRSSRKWSATPCFRFSPSPPPRSLTASACGFGRTPPAPSAGPPSKLKRPDQIAQRRITTLLKY